MSSSNQRSWVDRRDFLRIMAAMAPLLATTGCSAIRHALLIEDHPAPEPELDDLGSDSHADHQVVTPVSGVHDPLAKVINFDQNFPDDVYASFDDQKMIQALVTKFRVVQRYVGSGHFNLLGVEEFFEATEKAGRIEAITSAEKKFMETLFFREAKLLGFQGARVFKALTDGINKRDAYKVPDTGHYLHRGASLETYLRIKKDVGRSLILTSGVRALAKQFHLFLEKTIIANGNYSRASRSLAPPGYSFHGLHDFDVGKIGFGPANFTDEFASTSEFQELTRLGYVNIRYKERNELGVRFEPWHIQV